MRQIVLRIRPAEVMEDLDLDLIRERAMGLVGWESEVQDTRLSDAPYVSVVAKIPEIDAAALARLKAAFEDLPRMRVLVWRRVGVEVPLDVTDIVVLEEATYSLNQTLGRD